MGQSRSMGMVFDFLANTYQPDYFYHHRGVATRSQLADYLSVLTSIREEQTLLNFKRLTTLLTVALALLLTGNFVLAMDNEQAKELFKHLMMANSLNPAMKESSNRL